MKRNDSPVVTNVELTLFRNSPVLAFASVDLFGLIRVSDFALLPKSGGYRVGWPQKTLKNGEKILLIVGLREEITRAIESAIIEKYKQILRASFIMDKADRAQDFLEGGAE